MSARIPHDVALQNFNQLHSRWFKNGIDVTDTEGDYAVQRLANDVFTPSIADSWIKEHRVQQDVKVFAIGSCFARGIEIALRQADFDVVSYASEFDGFEVRNDEVTGRGFTNKYTTFAIENELRWALDPESPFPIGSLVEEDPGVVVDPHVNPTLKWLYMEATIARHQTISDVYRRISECELIVITLGLVETWFDNQEGVWLNMSPSPKMMRQFPGRYEFAVTDFAENRAALDRITRLVEAHGHPDAHIVVTVSPVPLMATFSDRDVVTANAYSKSLLRVAAEEWSAAEERVHYFPSYEIVTQSAKEQAWEVDGRHVKGPIVNHIMSLFKQTYVG